MALAAFVSWAWTRGFWVAAPLALSLLPVALTYNIFMICAVPLHSISHSRTGYATPARSKVIHDVQTQGLGSLLALIQVATLVGCCALFIAWRTLQPVGSWSLAAVLCLLNAILAWSWFRLCVRWLDDVRSGDIGLNDNEAQIHEFV